MINSILKISNRLTLYYLVAFYVLAYSETISEAGKKMHISQPAITKMINKLEDEIGVKLFIRSHKGTKLTKNGEIFLEYVEKSFASLVAGVNLIDSKNKLNSNKIIIGTSPFLSSYLLKLMNKFRIKHPSISIEIIIDSAMNLKQLLMNGQIYFIVDNKFYKGFPNLIEKNLFSLEACFITDGKLSVERVKDIENVNLLLPSACNHVYNKIKKAFADKKLKLNYVCQFETNENIASSVKENLGIGFVIKNTISNDLKKGNIQILDIPVISPTVDVNIAYLKYSLSKNDKLFIEFCKSDYNIIKKISV